MDTVEQAISSLQQNESPFWWLWQGQGKVGQNVKEADINASILLLRQTLAILPSGSYKLEHSQNRNDRSGSFKFPFTKGSTAQVSMSQAQPIGNNPYNISDAAFLQLQNEIRAKVLAEQLHAKMDTFFSDVWPEYKRKIDTLWNEDADGDGTPDILDSVKKAGEAVGAIGQMKNAFKGASLFDV